MTPDKPTTEDLYNTFTKCAGGPNPYYQCRHCGTTHPGMTQFLIEHWQTCPERLSEDARGEP